MNAALHSIPVIVTPCTEKVKGLWRWRRVHTQSIRTVNSVTRSKLVTYSEPQALIIHHTVAAGFLYCKTTIIRVHTKQARTRSTFNEILFTSGRSVGDSCLFSQLMVVNRDARHK